MAAIPAWFDEASYLTSKLAQLKSIGNNDYANINQLKVAIEAAGYTTYSHFEQFSLVERTNPNDYFNTNEYLAAKAAALNTAAYQGKTNWTADTVALALQNAGFTSAYDHFAKVGWTENVNPSNAFDLSAYLATKAAALNAAAYNGKTDWTAADVQAAFVAAGVDPVAHYLSNGKTETGVAVTAVPAAEQVAAGVAGTFTLTVGVDQGAAFTGTAGNDTFVADYDVANSAHTLGALDVLKGGAGTDTLQITDQNGAFTFPAATLDGIEKVTVRGAAAATVNVSGSNITGLESVAVTQATAATVTAATTTDVSVSGVTGAIIVDGGKNTVVTDATAGNAITIGGTTVGAGSVTVTDTNQTSGAIAIDGGTSVTVTASKATTGTVKIGDTTAASVAADMPSGAVALTTTGAAYAATDVAATRGAITIVGGTTVTVNQVATSDSSAAATDTTTIGKEITQSNVNVTGSSATTSVTVNQSAAVAAVNGVAAVAGAYETQKVTFVALAATETVVVNGLTFTASKALTAAEVAAAFANLTNGATQGSAPAGNGVYSGTFSTVGGSTGAVTTAAGVSTVTFTSATKADVAALTVNDTAAAGNVSVADVAAGSAETTAVTGVLGVVGGTVTIEGNITGTDVLAAVSLDGYGASSAIDSDALTSLTLANSKADLVVNNTAATTLALSLNNIGTASSLDIGSTYTTLNVTATGADSDVTLVAGGVQTLTVAGDKAVDLSGATLTALKTVTVSGSAGLTINASGTNVTAVNTAATTGTVTATVDASKATYTGGAGADNVTLSSTTVSKAVNTGAGNDKVTLASGTTSLTEAIVAGDGTDTLVMDVADAATASASNVFETKIDGFEKLSLGALTAGTTKTVDLANMDDISYVISANTPAVTAVNAVYTFDLTGAVLNFDAVNGGDTLTIGAATLYTATADAEGPVTIATAIDGTTIVIGGVTYDIDATDPAAVTFTAQTAANNSASITIVANDVSGDTAATAPTTASETPSTNGVAAVASGSLTLDKMANNGTLELTGAGAGVTVTMADATSTTADIFNIVTKVDAADLNFGTVAVAGVETVNITVTDTTPVNVVTGAATISKATLTVSDSDVKSIVVTGNSDLDLTAAGASLTSVNAANLTGKLAFSSAVNSAVITGGSAADTLTATGNSQTLNGGAGADTLIVTGDLATLSGGAGNDVFNIGNATTNVNSYATITDLAAGDVIKFTAAAADFVSAKVTLGDTAVFQDLANAAIANSDTGDVAWFQFSGNTYVIENVSNNASAFVNNTDIIVKITGLVDLSTASFSSSADTLLIV